MAKKDSDVCCLTRPRVVTLGAKSVAQLSNGRVCTPALLHLHTVFAYCPCLIASSDRGKSLNEMTNYAFAAAHGLCVWLISQRRSVAATRLTFTRFRLIIHSPLITSAFKRYL